MNKFVVVFYWLAFVGAAIATPKLDAKDLACIAETKVSEADVIQFFTNYAFDQNDHDFKCFIKCNMLKENLVNENGDFNPQALVDRAAKHKNPADRTTLEEKAVLFNNCDNSDVTGDACERAAAAAKCLFDLLECSKKYIFITDVNNNLPIC